MWRRLSFLVSMPFMGVLMVLLIVVLALATFVESAYDTNTAWAVAYGTRWFELLLLLLGINVVGVMIRYKFYTRKKLVVFVFHLAFILILAGAAITRFISYEGMMHIRENQSSSTMLSSSAWVEVVLEAGNQTVENSKQVRLSELTPGDYRMRGRLNGDPVKVRSTGYMARAREQYVSAPGGEPYLQLVLVTDRQSSVGIPSGSTRNVFGMDMAFNANDTAAILRFESVEDGVEFYAPFRVTTTRMDGGEGMTYQPGEPVPLRQGALYTLGHMRMALQNYLPSARKQLVRASAGEGGHLGAVRMEIIYRGMVSEVYVPGLARVAGVPVEGTMGDLSYRITYGSREIQLPFSLYLEDFEVERYPGSNSPSSFASEVLLIDEEMDIREKRRIFMNNVLKHRGYRFYQSSYDTDEKGTILSVNKDWAGTFVTYIGYIVLIGGMILAMFMKGTRFSRIARRTSSRAGKAAVALLVLLLGLPAMAQEVPPREVAREFGTLWVQDRGGRYEPMNTLAHEVVRKVTRKSEYRDYNPEQVMLGMILYPEIWQQIPLFKVTHPELHRRIGHKGELVSFSDLMGQEGNDYLLSELVNDAYSKQVAARTELDKEVIKLDDRINAMYLVQSGGLLRIFPDSAAENHSWASVSDALRGGMNASADSMGRVFLQYLHALQAGNYTEASFNLELLLENQVEKETLLPSRSKKELEILYNRANLFPRLAKLYGVFGLLLMVLQFLIVFRPGKRVKLLFQTGVAAVSAAFLLHTLALVARWYISGHAPMSNGYESMIFVAWVTILAGLIFVRRSGYAMALTAILAALALMVAQMSNMNPEITNLVPVLKSPWLTIHVTVIMAGYGFLGLASIMGLMNVTLYAFLRRKSRNTLKEVISQVTRVNHLTLIVGLYFMTAGVFLGGVWANESWGRYWGWDPKETWARTTVMVYAFMTHMHKIPGLRGTFAFNLASFVAYGSVLMTYFGVNYFLGGIHSYAGGSAFTLPWYSYLIIVMFAGLSGLAWYKAQKFWPDRVDTDISDETVPDTG